jgi:DNA-binding MarR family transcriptional regulator
MIESSDFLRLIFTLLARQAMSPKDVRKAIGKSPKLVAAYNLCDGSATQGELAKQLKLDRGYFSRVIAGWIEAGIVYRVENGGKTCLLHLYPVRSETTERM